MENIVPIRGYSFSTIPSSEASFFYILFRNPTLVTAHAASLLALLRNLATLRVLALSHTPFLSSDNGFPRNPAEYEMVGVSY